jgi:hypothetical protein
VELSIFSPTWRVDRRPGDEPAEFSRLINRFARPPGSVRHRALVEN